MSKNMLSEAQDEFYWPRHRWLETLSPQEIARLAFTAGAKWATKATSELSPHIARFIEMMILLGWFDNAEGQQVSAELAAEQSEATAGDSTPTGGAGDSNDDLPAMHRRIPISTADPRDDARFV
jgi:hypothetical protein